MMLLHAHISAEFGGIRDLSRHLSLNFYEHARSEHARQWEPFHVRACVSFCSWGPLGTVRHCQHRVLRPLISNLRSDATSEVIWRPPWPQRPTNWWLEATCT